MVTVTSQMGRTTTSQYIFTPGDCETAPRGSTMRHSTYHEIRGYMEQEELEHTLLTLMLVE